MRVSPYQPRSGAALDVSSEAWDDGEALAVRAAALEVLPVKLKKPAWSEHELLGSVAIGRTGKDTRAALVAVPELDAQALVAGLALAAGELPADLEPDAAAGAELLVLTGVVPADVQAALALIGPSVVRVFLVDPAVAEVDGAGDVAEEVAEDSGPLTSARGRRRGRPAVPPQAPAEQLATVSGLVGETELALDGTDGAIRGVLSADGVLTVGGVDFTDPLEAAKAQGREVSDGWAAWRFGVDGPYLGEALEEAANLRNRKARPPRRHAVRR